MQSGKVLMALLAAGSLAFGAGVVFAATSESTQYSSKPEASKATPASAPTESNQLTADSIRILRKPAKMAAKKAGLEKAAATPAASKTEGYNK